MVDDKTLVSQVVCGDMQAFRVLIKKHERLVAHMIGRVVRNNEEKEELCQDVFLKVYDKLAGFQFQSKLSTWIATIAYRHAINAVRKRSVQWSELPDESSFNTKFITVENPGTIVEDSDMDEYVMRLIDELPTQYKLVLSLFHIEQMTYEEIGVVTGMPEGTIKSYLFRARTLLKEKVKLRMIKEPGL